MGVALNPQALKKQKRNFPFSCALRDVLKSTFCRERRWRRSHPVTKFMCKAVCPLWKLSTTALSTSKLTTSSGWRTGTHQEVMAWGGRRSPQFQKRESYGPEPWDLGSVSCVLQLCNSLDSVSGTGFMAWTKQMWPLPPMAHLFSQVLSVDTSHRSHTSHSPLLKEDDQTTPDTIVARWERCWFVTLYKTLKILYLL